MTQPDLKKRIVLTRYWVGDAVYHRKGGGGIILHVQLTTDRCVPRYYIVFEDREGEWCEEMELTTERMLDGFESVEKNP